MKQRSDTMMEILTWLESSRLATWLNESPSLWAYPTVLTLHTVGLAMLIGANAAFGLRVLGVGKAIELSAFAKLFPLMWIGLALNASSGFLLFVKDATTKGTMDVFFVKLLFVAGAIVAMFLLKRTVYRGGIDAAAATTSARTWAVVSMLLWSASIFAGRFMAYPGMEIFGVKIS